MKNRSPQGAERSLRALLVLALAFLIAALSPGQVLSRGSVPTSQFVNPNSLYGVATPHSLPSGLGWALPEFAPAVLLSDAGGLDPSVGTVGISDSALFDLYSTARSAPGATYYVNSTGGSATPTLDGVPTAFAAGSNGNSGLSAAAPFQTLQAAVSAANANSACATAGARIVNVGGLITQDLCNITSQLAVDGEYVFLTPTEIGNIYQSSTWALDGTFTNCYSWTRANWDRELDLTRKDKWGNYVEFKIVPTAARCNVTPDSVAYVSGVLYLNRADGAVPTVANTRTLVASVGNMFSFAWSGAPRSVHITAQNGATVACYGGLGAFSSSSTSPQPTRRAFVASYCRFLFAGGTTTGWAFNGFGAAGINGIVAAYHCQSNSNGSDGFNFHNPLSGGGVAQHWLTVDCQGCDNGRPGVDSVNGLTSHDDKNIGVDVGGDYRENRGGSCRFINNSRQALFGTLSSDLGSLVIGGTVAPAAFMADDTAIVWCDSTKADMGPGTRSYFTSGAGATIFLRNSWPTRGTTGGAGTVAAFVAMVPATATEAATNRHAFSL